MRKLFFSVMALTIGALTFISCDKEDDLKEDINKEKEREKEQEKGDSIKGDTLKVEFLSFVQQQEIFSNTLNSVAGAIEFTNLAQIANIVVEELGYPINFDGAIDAMCEQDPILARKIAGLKKLMESDQLSFDFESMYFEADIAFRDTFVYDTLVYVPYLVSVNHNADRFLINIDAVDNHKYTLSLKGNNDSESRVKYVTPEKTSSITLPNALDFSLSLDGNTVLSVGGDYSTDFMIEAAGDFDSEENDTVLKSLIINGQNFKGSGQIVLDKYLISAAAEYSAQTGLKADGSLMIGGIPALSVNAVFDATISEYVNWAETASIMSWAMDYNAVRALDVTAALGGDQIKFVLGLKENPVKYPEIMTPVLLFSTGSQPDPDAIKAMVDKFNELFAGEVYFKGYDKPQAVIKLAYADPSVSTYGTKGVGEDISILKEMLGNLLVSGLYLEVATYDADGNEITVSMQEYFGKIDLSNPVQKVVANFSVAFGPLLSMFSEKEEGEYID